MVTAPQGVCALYGAVSASEGYQRSVTGESLSGGPADLAFKYGRADDTAIAGDWNGDGKDTVGVRRGNVYHLTDALKGGVSTDVRTFGQASDVVAFGDWDGNKSDTPAVVTTK